MRSLITVRRGELDRHVNGRGGVVACGCGTTRRRIPASTQPTTDGRLLSTSRRTDAAGNTATATRTLTLDRGTAVAITRGGGGDNTDHAAEACDGIVITVRRSRAHRPVNDVVDGCCERTNTATSDREPYLHRTAD
jgi:hypothetical protein